MDKNRVKRSVTLEKKSAVEMKNVGSRRGRGEREREREVNRALERFARVTMSRYLRRGNDIEEENVGFYSD